MIIFLIALILLIVNIILFIRDCRKGVAIPISLISLLIIISANIISFTMVIESLVNNISLEKRLNNQYETLIKNIYNPYAISDIIKYNEEVINGKYYLSNSWTSWYVESAYEDAKIIEIGE